MNLATFALVGQLATTLPLLGLIWTVQVLVYPQFARVSPADFPAYHRAHARLITFVVGPLMLGELVFAALWFVAPIASVPALTTWAGAGLVIAAWAATAFLSVPQHDRLASGFDASAHATLVATNWVRTAVWTLRTALLIWVTVLWLHPAA